MKTTQNSHDRTETEGRSGATYLNTSNLAMKKFTNVVVKKVTKASGKHKPTPKHAIATPNNA